MGRNEDTYGFRAFLCSTNVPAARATSVGRCFLMRSVLQEGRRRRNRQIMNTRKQRPQESPRGPAEAGLRRGGCDR